MVDIPEATPFKFCASNEPQPRINLLVPALSEEHVFGGISTALRFFEQLVEFFPSARIIITDETSTQLKNGQFYSDWQIKDVGDADVIGNVIVVAGNRVGRDFFIRENDYFISTAWWTAMNGFCMLQWQQHWFGLGEQRKQVYFIQDYEPGFYPWSARYALAEATYRKDSQTIAVFNTKLLRDYFSLRNYVHSCAYYFDPILNPTLKALAKNSNQGSKVRQILCYGRPSVERNLFPLIIQSLRYWAENYPDASNWKVVSAGEPHETIELGNGVTVESLGKLSLEEYSNVLERTSVGISLMLSPHPSYPPLEMAAFGARVITNSYENKDLSKLVTNTITPTTLDPQDIAKSIINACELYGVDFANENKNGVFSNEEKEFPFVKDVFCALKNDLERK